jgi:hypothetical protein
VIDRHYGVTQYPSWWTRREPDGTDQSAGCRWSIGVEPCGSAPVLFEEPAGPGFSAKSRCAAVIDSAIAVSTLHRDGVVIGACGKWIDIRTIVPSIC